jgi:hypothetical protein
MEHPSKRKERNEGREGGSIENRRHNYIGSLKSGDICWAKKSNIFKTSVHILSIQSKASKKKVV